MEQRSKEWFDARKGRITASLVGAILGVAPYMTREDAMRRMVRDYHGAPAEFTGNVATEWGVANEAGAKFDFTLETGIPVEDCGFFTLGDVYGASPDGLIGDDAILEIKCPFSLRDKENPIFKQLRDQPHYYAQVQFQLLVSSRRRAYFWQWAPKGTMLEVVDYDQFWVNENLPELDRFYVEYLSQINNPAHIEPKRKIVETLTAQRLLDEYDQIQMAIEIAESRKKEIMAEFESFSGGRDAIICGRNFTKVEKAGSISYAKAIKDLAPNADLEPYRGKPTSYWKLS